ncbi:hypothetical protein [Ferrovum sp.]|uniref:hypothetical protein n=1 Tax=Ferrovum sp. TaxID=2609467 RepID=UPI00262E4253|nr:hypothetical protein [Ferrovum sp.]
MKRFLLVIAVSLMPMVSAYAEDSHHPDSDTGATVSKPAQQAEGESIKQMQNQVMKMKSLLERYGKTRSNEEHQKLMSEYRQAMQENMMTAKAMMGGQGMSCPMMDRGGVEGQESERLMGWMQQMEKRMDMMQMMMERVNKSAVVPTPEK